MVGRGKSLGTRIGHKITFIVPFVKCSTIHTVMNWNETMEVLVLFPDHHTVHTVKNWNETMAVLVLFPDHLYSPHSEELE